MPPGSSGLADTAATANTPVSKVPVSPPMPCTPNTSSESSYPNFSFSQVQAQKQTAPAMIPISTPCIGNTKPDAGVMVPRPATAPEIMPSTDGLPRVHHSSATQVQAPALAARRVEPIAIAARPLAPSAEPPLNPNQPTHSRPVPMTARVRSNGARLSVP